MEVLRLLESIRGDIFAEINLIFTKMGEEIVIFVLLCLIYWCIDKKLGYRLAFSYLVAGFIVNAVKVAAKIPRPFIKDSTLTPEKKALNHATGYSFPSGHTQASTSLYGTLAIYLKRYNIFFSVLLFLPIACVGFSRMYLGVHTPYDVAAGFAIAMIVNITVNYLFDNYCLDSCHYRRILIIITLLGFGLMLFSAVEMVYFSVPFDKGIDCFKIGSCIIGFIFGWYIEVTKVRFNERGTGIAGQFLKFICGIIGLALCYKGTEALLLLFLPEKNFAVNTVPYFLTTFWITGGFPIIIRKVFTSPYNYRN